MTAIRRTFLDDAGLGAAAKRELERANHAAPVGSALEVLLDLYAGPSSRFLNFYGPARSVPTLPYDQALDGSGVIGPWLITSDLIDGDNLGISLTVNGQKRQSSNTSDMVFNTKQLVSYISDYMTLNPGDLIFTGTPEGVISGYPKDKQVWLKAGDKLVTSIDKLGDQHLTLT